ncbi:hypothetical protein EDB19DRAFT_1831160 [Suillus lakei]|nr:hypothetical protein EDB19DRAFT_1831160 [Suillus lakei]
MVSGLMIFLAAALLVTLHTCTCEDHAMLSKNFSNPRVRRSTGYRDAYTGVPPILSFTICDLEFGSSLNSMRPSNLLDVLIDRVNAGQGLDHLEFISTTGILDRDVKLLREAVADVSWDGYESSDDDFATNRSRAIFQSTPGLVVFFNKQLLGPAAPAVRTLTVQLLRQSYAMFSLHVRCSLNHISVSEHIWSRQYRCECRRFEEGSKYSLKLFDDIDPDCLWTVLTVLSSYN